MITKKNYKVDLAKLSEKKVIYEFAREMHFHIKAKGKKTTRDRTFIKLTKSTAIMASGISTISLPFDAKELCERLKLLLQEKPAGNKFDIINEEIIAIVDKLLEY